MRELCVLAEVSRLQTEHRLHCEVRRRSRGEEGTPSRGNRSRILWPDAHLFTNRDTRHRAG